MSPPFALEVELGLSPCCRIGLDQWSMVRGFPLERCSGCGSAFVNPRPTLDLLMQHYAAGGHGEGTASSLEEVVEAESLYPNSTVDARRILDVVARFAPGSRLLDVGSGYGFYSKEAINRGFKVHALEVSSFERQCTREISGVEPTPLPFEEYRANPESYDVILMSQILEHAVNPRGWVKKAGRLLSHGGIIAVALPNFDSFIRFLLGIKDPLIHPPDHLNYFNEEGLTQLLLRGPFELISMSSISRLPGSAFTDRVPIPDSLERPVEGFIQMIQRPFLYLPDALGLGMFLNLYAAKGSSSELP